MATQDEWHRVTVRLPPETHEALKELAIKDNRSINAQMVEVLNDWIENRAALGVFRGNYLAEAAEEYVTPTDLEERLTVALKGLSIEKQEALLILLRP